VTAISDGTEIMKRLPRALPKPTVHIIGWFHIAIKIQPMQQVADHIVRSRDEWTNETVILDEEIRALKWKLWHGQVDRPAIAKIACARRSRRGSGAIRDQEWCGANARVNPSNNATRTLSPSYSPCRHASAIFFTT
jgi:hypothetical protein